jgi:hypothetical protein
MQKPHAHNEAYAASGIWLRLWASDIHLQGLSPRDRENRRSPGWGFAMTIPETPPPCPTMPGDKNHERPDRALEEPVKDEWIDDFMRRLNCTIEEAARKD